MFEPMFMRLALAASVASGLTLGVLGVYLAIRRIVFFGLVLANAATLGAAVAEAMGWPRALCRSRRGSARPPRSAISTRPAACRTSR